MPVGAVYGSGIRGRRPDSTIVCRDVRTKDEDGAGEPVLAARPSAQDAGEGTSDEADEGCYA